MDNITEVIANNLQNIRREKQLTLQDLSDLTGVSKSMLGEIERGVTNPTITILWKIITGLKVTLSQLVNEEQAPYTIVRKDNRKKIQEVESLIFEYETEKNFEIYHIEFTPGYTTHSESHQKGISEYILVYEGTLSITVGTEKFVLDTGDSMFFNGDNPHEYTNEGNIISRAYSIIHYKPTDFNNIQ